MSYQKESSKVLCSSKIGTPPRFEMDWKAPEDSVSHGLCKQWWGGVPNQFIKSVHV